MTLERKTVRASSRLPRALLLGTASAALIGGGVIGAVLPTVTAANAEAVVIDQPISLPSFADVVEEVSPAVVRISVRGEQDVSALFDFDDGLPEDSPLERFFRGQPEEEEEAPAPVPTSSLGSGFLISGDGYIVTNSHVVDDADELTVIMDDGTEYPARVIGQDDQTDLALIKVDADRDFTYVRFAEEETRIGDWVLAVGTPFGLGGTVTAGIVSANGRQISDSAYDDYLQIDAAINTGNSGGPTFNLAGEVVGVVTAIYSPTGGNVGIAFAVPSEVAASVIDDLRDDGVVERGWLGVVIQSVTTEIADALALDEAAGALVGEVTEGSPAEAAGLEPGDVVLSIDGNDVADSTDLARKTGAIAPGTEVDVIVWRDGAEVTVPVTLGMLPGNVAAATPAPSQEPPAPLVFEDLGLNLLPGEGGAPIVGDLDPASRAASYGLVSGDVIVAVNNEEMTSPAEVEAAIDAAKAAGREAVLFRVERQGTTLHFAVPF